MYDYSHQTNDQHRYGLMHWVLMVDVNERLDGFDDQRKTKRSQKYASAEHHDHFDSCPTKRIFQLVFEMRMRALYSVYEKKTRAGTFSVPSQQE